MIGFFLCLLHLALCAVAGAERCYSNRNIRMTNFSVLVERDTYYLAGGLQVCFNHEWATVCQTDFTYNDAVVACRQIGLPYSGRRCRNSCFGNIQTDPSYFRFECRGNERRLADCRKQRRNPCVNAIGVYCALNRTVIKNCVTTTDMTTYHSKHSASTRPLTTDHLTTKPLTINPLTTKTRPLTTNISTTNTPTTDALVSSEYSQSGLSTTHTPHSEEKSSTVEADQQFMTCHSTEQTILIAIIVVLFIALIIATGGIIVAIVCIKWNKKKVTEMPPKDNDDINESSKYDRVQHNVAYFDNCDIYDDINVSSSKFGVQDNVAYCEREKKN